jgi:hypothetical protein
LQCWRRFFAAGLLAFSAFCLGCAGVDSATPNQGDLKKGLKITAHPQGAVYSQGAQAVAMFVGVEADAGAVLSYQWYSGAAGNNMGGSVIEGAQGASYMPPTVELGVVYYYVTVTSLPSGGGAGDAATSSAARIEVNNLVNAAVPEVSIDTDKTSYFEEEPAAPIVAQVSASDGGRLGITWYKNSENSNTGGLAVAYGPECTPGTSAGGVFYYYCVASNTISGAGGGVATQTAASPVIAITVGGQAIRDVADLLAAIAAGEGGGKVNDVPVPVELPPLVWTDAGGWEALFETIYAAGKYVSLDMSRTPPGLSADFSYSSGSSPNANSGKGYVVSFVLPDGVKQIVYNNSNSSSSPSAFNAFSWITAASGAGVKTLGYQVFAGKSKLKTVNFPQAESIGNSAFQGCANLETVEFPRARTIGIYAFQGAKLASCNFSEVTTLGYMAFSSASLTSVSFPNVKEITAGSEFKYCSSLVSITDDWFPNLVKITGNEVFYYCTALSAVSFPKLKVLNGKSMFGDSSLALEKVNIPAIESIGAEVFKNIGGSTTAMSFEITMGPNAPTLAANIFSGITSQKTVTVNIPAGADGYGDVREYSGDDLTECWANGFRCAGWEAKDGGGFGFTYGGSVNTNITVILQEELTE